MIKLIALVSHIRHQGPPDRNRNTEVWSGAQPATKGDLQRAYQFARGVLQMQPDNTVGHRLVWVRGSAFASATIRAHDDAFLIVGRHTQCGMILPDDPFVALRHLLVRSIALPSGGVALRIFDLHSDIKFRLGDGSVQSSIFAEGPVAIGLGEYALVALPNDLKDAPGELPAPVVDTPPAVRDQIKALEAAMSPYRANARPQFKTRITLMPVPVMVGEALPPSLGRLAGGSYSVTLERGGRGATVTLSEEDLQRGVIIGRSEKCHSETLRQLTDMGTSRVHVLLLKEGDRIYGYDLASTQGTYAFGSPVRRVVLPDTGICLFLGGARDAVRLTWVRRS